MNDRKIHDLKVSINAIDALISQLVCFPMNEELESRIDKHLERYYDLCDALEEIYKSERQGVWQ